MGGKNEIMYHHVTSFLLFSVIKFYFSESASLLIHNLLLPGPAGGLGFAVGTA